jgi:hypothetical protein
MTESEVEQVVGAGRGSSGAATGSAEAAAVAAQPAERRYATRQATAAMRSKHSYNPALEIEKVLHLLGGRFLCGHAYSHAHCVSWHVDASQICCALP